MTTEDILKGIVSEIQKELDVFPYNHITISTLGGAMNAALMLVFSLDAKDKWEHGYIENSRYVRMSIDRTKPDGYSIEVFVKSGLREVKTRNATVPMTKVVSKFAAIIKPFVEAI